MDRAPDGVAVLRPGWHAGAGGAYASIPNHELDLPVSHTADESTRIAAGKTVSILMKQELLGSCTVNSQSVYGVALAMPQIARSAGWSRTFTGLTVRAFVHLLLNFLVQGVVLYQIDLESNAFAEISGQMHLCNFGQYFESCPGKTDCTGPGGSTYARSWMVSRFSTWHTRAFLKQSLLAVLPEQADNIRRHVHTGEYGMESPICRAICVFIFVVDVIDDLYDTMGIVRLLLRTPSSADTWLSYDPPQWGKETDKMMFKRTEIDYVKFHVNGMPFCWKLANFVVIVVPKIVLWTVLLIAGTQFLMETASIEDLIINSLALAFILQIDEIIANRLCTEATKEIMAKLEGYDLYNLDTEEAMADSEVLRGFEEGDARWRCYDTRFLKLLLPRRLILILLVTTLVYNGYFRLFCQASPDGSLVSLPLYAPKIIPRVGLPSFFQRLVNPHGVERDTVPTWTMPG